MSEHYLFNFSFGLDPHLPEGAVRVFKSLVAGEPPEHEDLAALPAPLRDYLVSPGMLHGGMDEQSAGTGSRPVRMVWLGESPGSQHHARMPEWEVAFSVSVHDDWLANGAYTLYMAMLEIVGHDGLYCTEYEAGQRDLVTHYYREDDDLLIVRMEAPYTVGPMPPGLHKTRSDWLPDWKPATEESFRVGSVTRITRAMREKAYAEVDEMYRAEGWRDGDDGATRD
ncbi:hypothetical protein Poly30_33460 [Planctomycetes bacterium Poly30]|uniref:Uncharacterized protein n=1 Tax=Saltatorellus ferox TaxID=2528018 RepID=A0A518EUN6_9BACT|nr:hypothetical protein Poly30_33460 [Planctomycetes bacterium Poly30]